jgi:type I restriction enzyme S subunit
MSIKRKNRISECCDILDNLRVPINDEIRQTMQGNIPYYGANGIQGYIDKYIFDEDLILLAEDGETSKNIIQDQLRTRLAEKVG